MSMGNESEFSETIPGRPPLLTPAGAVSIAGAAETAISTAAGALRFGYLLQMEAICTVAGTTAGTWTLRAAVAGTVRLSLQQPIVAANVGTRYIWQFPMPWKTDAVNAQFTIQNSVATMGTWIWNVNGFTSSL